MLSWWEIQVTRLRAESVPDMHQKTLGGAEAMLLASVGDVVVGPGFRVAGRRQEVTAKSQASAGSNVDRSVMVGQMREAIRLRAGLEQARLSCQRAEPSFLGGFAEDMGDRIVSVVTVSGTQADCGVMAEAIEDTTTQVRLFQKPCRPRACGDRRDGAV